MEFRRYVDAKSFLFANESALLERDPQTNLILHNAYRLRDTLQTTRFLDNYLAVLFDNQRPVLYAVQDLGRPLCLFATTVLSRDGVRLPFAM